MKQYLQHVYKAVIVVGQTLFNWNDKNKVDNINLLKRSAIIDLWLKADTRFWASELNICTKQKNKKSL